MCWPATRAGRRVAAKPDDVALVSKALDELEAQSGSLPSWQSRAELRRLAALAQSEDRRLKALPARL